MKTTVVALVACLAAAIPAVAHHSFAAEFDSSKPVTIKGTVTKLDWINPHARFYLDVAGEGGQVIKWEFELGSPNSLMRTGWNRNSLKQGDVVSVDAFVAKDGFRLASAREVRLADGRRVFGGSSYNAEENEKK